MNNINLQVIRTVDYLIDVEVDDVHVCFDTTEDDVGDIKRWGLGNLIWKYQWDFSRVSFGKDNGWMGSVKHFRISSGFYLCT